MDYSYESNEMSFPKYLSKCFMWMFLGLLFSFATAALFSYTGLFESIYFSFGMGFTLVISLKPTFASCITARSLGVKEYVFFFLSWRMGRPPFLIIDRGAKCTAVSNDKSNAFCRVT